MTRTVTSAVVAEVTKTGPNNVVRPIIMVDLDFASGAVRLWNGIGNISYGGNTFLGSGDLGSMAGIEETNELKASGVSMSLSGIPSDMISTALAEQYQGRTARIYIGFMNEGDQLVDVLPIFLGRLDVMAIDEGAETATITVSAENVLVALERPNERRYTAEDQRIQFPDDKGFDFVVSLQEKEVVWGQG